MIQRPPDAEDRLPPLTPQLALRVAVIGTCALVMFAVIFFRLWFLQVLSGSQYVAQASVNSTRTIPVAAPRGEILDSSDHAMVTSSPVPTVQLDPLSLPAKVTVAGMIAARDRPPGPDIHLYEKLASLLGLSMKQESCTIDGKYPIGAKYPNAGTRGTIELSPIACLVAQSVANVPYDDVTIATNVNEDIEYYLAERQADYRGVVVQQQWVRQYPLGDAGAQLFGTVGPITSAELNTKHFAEIPETDEVGQTGLEYQYNEYLQGKDGTEKVRVNSAGQFEYAGKTTPAIAGDDLETSIDAQLQQVGERSLATSIADNDGSGGAFVAMDPDNGQVYAMGSNPTYDPSVFTHPISQSKYNALFGPNSGDPQINRAIQSVGPTGSTFKVITATAALESGDWDLSDSFDDTGNFCLDGECRRNAGGAAYGNVGLVTALEVSDDGFFYNLGARTDDPAAQGGPLQAWAKQFGIGRRSGIDLPGEEPGTRPTPQWRAERNELETECETATGPFSYTDGRSFSRVARKGFHPSPKRPASQGGCGITVTDPEEPWTVGDNENMAVGQGDVQVTPLQLAVVYAALANGGSIVTPHIGEDIQTSNGTIVERIDPGIKRPLNIAPAYLDAILEGLREAASSPSGTSADVMGSFPKPVYGKTGTAQYNGSADYSWYACFVPASATSKPIVVVVWVEKGGFGDVAAAPVARQILSQWFYGKPGVYKSGVSHDQ